MQGHHALRSLCACQCLRWEAGAAAAEAAAALLWGSQIPQARWGSVIPEAALCPRPPPLRSVPPSSILPHHSPLTPQPVHWQTVVWLRPDTGCTQRQALRHRRRQSNDTGEEPSDVFGQEDEDFSLADCYLLCHEGERIRPFLPKPCGSAAWPLDGAHWPLIHGGCVAVWECGSGLISLWQRQIEGTDFDNVKKEIRFFPSCVSREADKMAVWSVNGTVCFRLHTSLYENTQRLQEFRFNNMLRRKTFGSPKL